jgi:hypothetical protein
MLSDVVPGSAIGRILRCRLIWQLFTKWAGLVGGFYLTIGVYRKVNVTMDVR